MDRRRGLTSFFVGRRARDARQKLPQPPDPRVASRAVARRRGGAPMTIAATTYQWYLSIHILAAVLWVGGAFTIQLLAIRAARPNARLQLGSLASEIEWVGTRLFIPSSLILVIMGFLLVSEGNLDYELWIVFAIAVWAASFISGIAFLGPQSGKLGRDVEQYGPDSPQAMARLQKIFLVSRIELVLLLLVVLDMALKPGS